MKYIIAFIVGFLILVECLQSQNCIIEYIKKDRIENLSFDPGSIPVGLDMKRILDDLGKTEVIYNLSINGGKSRFEHIKAVDKNGRLLPSIVFKNPYYQDVSLGKLIIQSSRNSDVGVVTKLSDINQWTIMEMDTLISGFICRKAINKYDNITAYFTYELDIPIGPWHYSGLPGLIIMIEDYTWRMVFKGIEFQDTPIEITFPNDSFKRYISFQNYLNTHGTSTSK